MHSVAWNTVTLCTVNGLSCLSSLPALHVHCAFLMSWVVWLLFIYFPCVHFLSISTVHCSLCSVYCALQIDRGVCSALFSALWMGWVAWALYVYLHCMCTVYFEWDGLSDNFVHSEICTVYTACALCILKREGLSDYFVSICLVHSELCTVYTV